jgi:DNA polymerase-3 subunit epsilon/CBS domain-containing protein
MALPQAREAHHRAGWVEPCLPNAGAAGTLKIDSYPYRHRVRDVMTAPAKFVAPDALLGDVLRSMGEARVSSFFVAFAEPSNPENTGILTERDAMRCVARHGAEALGVCAGAIASRPLANVSADDLMFVAMARMNRLKLRHLGVVDDTRRIVGALSARDLLRQRAEEAVALGDEISTAADTIALGRAWAKLPEVAASLGGEGLSGRETAVLISHQLAALTARAAALAEQRLLSEGAGPPPCPYVLAVLGSAGRGESLLAMDQDNALIFSDGGDTAERDRWFAELSRHACDILHDVGVPYCAGGVMARNPQWRGPVSAWRQKIGDWVRRSKPEDLLAVDIFFDLRGVHGELGMAERLWQEAFDAARGQASFAKLLVASVGELRSGLTFFGGLRTEHGRIDIKKSGLFGIVTVARALAICHHMTERSTLARLDRLKALGRSEADLDALSAAQELFLDLLLAQQIDDIRHGVPPSNGVEVKRLSRQKRKRLREALEAVSRLDHITRDLLFSS